jgi:hypothetical protein
MTVRELKERMDYEELLYWLALYNIRPFGDDADDLRAGIVSATVYNSSMGTKGGKKPLDFMPYLDRYKKPTTLLDKFKAWAKMCGKKG